MQQNCRLTAIIISIMITVCIIFMIYGFILAFIFSASVIGFYIYYLIENKKKQTLFLKGISQKYKMELIITSENVDENIELVTQKLRNQLFHINWIGFDYLRNKADKIIMSDFFMESKSEYPKFIFTSIGYFISRRKGSDHHSAIISYLNDSNLNLPRFVIFPNYSGLLTAIKGNVSKNNYSRKYQHKVSESEITKEFSRFEMFTDSPEYNKAIINTKIFPSLLKIDNMKKEFSATLICDGTEIFLATDGWVYNTDRLAKLIELFFLIRQELIKLKR